MKNEKKMPLNCPSCSEKLNVQSLICKTCCTNVTGNYVLPLLACLNPDEQEFVINFIKSSGSIKEMSKHLRLSYPSVRNILDEIIEKIKKLESHGK